MSVSDYGQVPRGTGEQALAASDPGVDASGATDLNKIDSAVEEQLVADEIIDVKQGSESLAAQIPAITGEDQVTILPAIITSTVSTDESQAP